MTPDLYSLSAIVQHNCHISDALHARNYTMCTYLLKMREYYRWEQRFPFNTSLPKKELGDWLSHRESLWEGLEAQEFEAISLKGHRLDPFETSAINQELLPHGLVYSGGYGGHAAPHFFLADLVRAERREGLPVLIAGREHARDMTAPPAMLLDGTLFVRRESMRRMLWEKIEEWRWKQKQDAMARAMACYDFDADFDRALERMTDNEVESAVLHELGEWRAEVSLGKDWPALLLSLSGTRGELVARAVRDHLADCLSTLPALLEQENKAGLHFYFANLKGMRRELFPELNAAYQDWIEKDDLQALHATTQKGADRWLETARCLLQLHRDRPETCADEIGRIYDK
ncbi:MAG: Sfum_1244 family protein [Pseudomonadota bacterium]